MAARFLFSAFIAAVSVAFTTFAPAKAALRDTPQITVLAAIGAEIPLVRVIRRYTRDNGVASSVIFSTAEKQMQDIAEGKSADIMITAHPKWTARLKQMGVLDVNSINNFLRDDLVIAVAAKNKRVIDPDAGAAALFTALIERRRPLFVADETVSALGVYTKQAFDNALIEEGTFPDDGINPLLTRASYVRTPAEIPQKIVEQRGAGVIYAAELRRRPELRILYTIPQKYYDEIIYQIAVVAGENMEAARALSRYLTDKKTLELFYAQGYRPLRYSISP